MIRLPLFLLTQGETKGENHPVVECASEITPKVTVQLFEMNG
jgi:hypothetical protein